MFFSQRYFSNSKIISRDNIFLNVGAPSEFVRMKARFEALIMVKKKYQEFTNFFQVYTTKFMEHMIMTQLEIEETRCQRIIQEG